MSDYQKANYDMARQELNAVKQANSYIEENLHEEFAGLATDLVDVTDFPELIKELVDLANEGMEEYTKDVFENLEEIKKLKEENKKFKEERQIIWDTMKKDPALVLLLPDSMYDVGVETESESEEESEDEKDDSLKEKFLESHNISEDDMKELMEQCGGRICPEDEESKEETDKYDGDDWRWVYGKMTVKNDDGFDDVVLCMAGGGDHWENWIMRPSMNYIENKNGFDAQFGKDLIQSSCGKYVSFQDKDYVPDDGECICEYEISVEC